MEAAARTGGEGLAAAGAGIASGDFRELCPRGASAKIAFELLYSDPSDPSELALFRRFNQQFYRLFEPGITKPCARYRRTRMVNTAEYQANAFLARAFKKIRKDVFEKMIVFLGWENVDRTNNHVERNNRVFRRLQKTRSKRRKSHTIEKALELELSARMVVHPLYKPLLIDAPLPREVSIPFEEPDMQKMAA